MIVEFLEGSGTDRQNRKLKDIWLMQHSEIENTHDFIQWVFPLNEPSSWKHPKKTSDNIVNDFDKLGGIDLQRDGDQHGQ